VDPGVTPTSPAESRAKNNVTVEGLPERLDISSSIDWMLHVLGKAADSGELVVSSVQACTVKLLVREAAFL
jgi:hypothetical protein